ncbi:YdcF family protein [Agarivorans sp. TSD2052]|uniref:SanA/YdcF family protein n=1 Tax=Agarivorans sp. TSD2052 TaxID=2937286 RepID=UPI00200C91DE|nr:ElyC/SanA/YdcF family protein [Agarivorans sp. TSD2052]UPW17212.1 YdcF family protein [Agarivorans sp. TSD2052]
MKRFLSVVLLMVIVVVLCLVAIDRYISQQVSGQWYRDMDRVPAQPVALVLGTSKYVGKRLNAYYQFRVEAAAKLYHTGKVNGLILSGDNATRYYNEPITMLNDVLRLNVPREHIALDYAGFRTFDSVVRAKAVFGQQALVIVSQQFHVERALYIANQYGIEAYGYVVDDAPSEFHWRVRLREVLARAKALIDLHVLNAQPHFLGDPEPVRLRDPELDLST